ncbi:MAG: DPP IV N-terminal domain-containing protein [Phycisphaeraceae bacterium]|nr:DPP IV N-terminal domain-containing protein [Phycisphaerae bacterium]MBX3392604.1 DPP IV N-terminal domain-containing protein [Phycisphaeraceae bacterium]
MRPADHPCRSRFITLALLAFAASPATTGAAFPGAASIPARDSAPAHQAAAPAPGDESFLTQWALTRGFSLGRPRNFSITPDGSGVLFLRSGPRSVVHDLYLFDTATGQERVLLTAERLLGGKDERLTPEERARRERLRQSNRGIVSYSLSEDGSKVLVPLGSKVFLYDLSADAAREIPVLPGSVIDPRLSRPGNLMGWVRENDLWFMDLSERIPTQVTRSADEFRTNGVSEFVAQEEMSRFEGYWFSPDERYVVYQHTDHTGVERLTIADPMRPENPAESPFYPRAGMQNASVMLFSRHLTSQQEEMIRWDRERFPYLANVKWPKGGPLTLLVQNREQTRQQLLRADHVTGQTSVIFEEQDDAWLNIDQSVPRWLEDGSGFLWISDSSGHDRLEWRGESGSVVRAISPPGLSVRGLVSYDEAARVAYAVCSDEPTEQHVWAFPLDEGASPRRITQGTGLFGAVFSKDHSTHVITSNTLGGEIAATVRRADGAVIGTVTSVAEAPPLTPTVEFVTLPGPHEFRALVVRPRDFDPSKRYPVLVSVYGGPTAQTVTATRQGQLLRQWHADRGFIVVSVDNRGTPGRGREWEKITKGNFIDIPLDDQVAALRQLGERYPEMDLGRVGMYGWSFGGYFAAMATMRRPDIFHCGVAGAPVADFADYDTHYTERYLGLPEKNPEGYKACNVLTYGKDLAVPLLIVHGTADDNVYFMHALKMADVLFKAGRDFEFLPLSGFTHMVPDPVVKERLETRISDFFRGHLGGPR